MLGGGAHGRARAGGGGARGVELFDTPCRVSLTLDVSAARRRAATRELRDRYLERVNETPEALPAGKYDVARALPERPGATRQPLLTAA